VTKRAVKLSRRRRRARSATIVFVLPEDREALAEAVSASDLAQVLRDYENWLRGLTKHSDADHEWATRARERLLEEVRGAGVADVVWP
jgi:hypothetical protein